LTLALDRLRRLVALATLAALTACGGHDANDDPPAPSAAQNEPDSAELSAPQGSTAPVTGLRWRGVNLSGAEFTASALPGRYGHQYVYPSVSSVDYFKAKGMNLIRLPFLWERLQPTLNAPLDTAELARLKAFVDGATAKGMTVLIDPHNYARYRSQVIGSAGVPVSAFGDFWSRLATVFKGNPRVLFGVMNEPFSMATESWVSAANEAIRRIRATGATNTIAVPGNAWSGAHSWAANWYGTPNAQAMLQITDSGHNLVFEAHQYLDADSSGTSSVCTSATIGAQRLVAFTAWLRTHGKRGLLGEFAGANNDTCRQALAGMLNYMEANSDVWAGWSYWAAGPWWGDDMFSIEPANGSDKPQMNTLQPYLN
jgi:endoglucanase